MFPASVMLAATTMLGAVTLRSQPANDALPATLNDGTGGFEYEFSDTVRSSTYRPAPRLTAVLATELVIVIRESTSELVTDSVFLPLPTRPTVSLPLKVSPLESENV